MVEIVGDLDIATVPQADTFLSDVADHPRHLILDLTHVAFLASSGLGFCSPPAPARIARTQLHLSCFAVFVDQVPAAAQAARTARVSCGVACSGHGPRNLAAMMTRRSLTAVSS
jgi:hypothetical protein